MCECREREKTTHVHVLARPAVVCEYVTLACKRSLQVLLNYQLNYVCTTTVPKPG